MKALIVDAEVVQLQEEEFPVVSGWYWVPVPEKIRGEIEGGWLYDRETDTFRPNPIESEEPSYDLLRTEAYPNHSDQFDMLWHMMDDETIPGKGSVWYNAIKAVKDKYPKP